MFKQPLNYYLPEVLDQLVIDYLDEDFIQKNIFHFPDHFIETNLSQINWNIVSGKSMPNWFVEKYHDKINWMLYLGSEHKKDVVLMYNFKNKIIENMEWIDKNVMYEPDFIDAFANTKIINWQWYVSHKKIPNYLLERYIDKIDPNMLIKFQKIPKELTARLMNYISWDMMSGLNLDEKFMELHQDMLNWDIIFTKQKLSCEFLSRFHNRSNIAQDLLPVYQELTIEFIIENHDWLNMIYVAQYQNMSYQDLQSLVKEPWFEPYLQYLLKNKNYNKKNTIQIFTNGKDWFILDKYKNTSEYFNEVIFL